MMAKSPVHHYNGTNVSNGRASQSSVRPPTLPHTVKLFVGKACSGRPRYGPSGPPREEVSRRLWRVLVLALTVPASSRTSSALLPANFIAAPSWLFWMLVTATFWPTSRREQVMGHCVPSWLGICHHPAFRHSDQGKPRLAASQFVMSTG